jgi:PAS domain S-box-containing protein
MPVVSDRLMGVWDWLITPVADRAPDLRRRARLLSGLLLIVVPLGLLLPQLGRWAGLRPLIIIAGPLSFFVVTSALVLFAVRYRNRVEADHLAEIRALQEFNERIVQSVNDGIVSEDEAGCFTFINPAAAHMLGYAPQELVGKHWMTIIPEDQHTRVQIAHEQRARGQTGRYEVDMLRKDGTRLSVLVSDSPLMNGGQFAGTLAAFIDITDCKRAEAEKTAMLGELRRRNRNYHLLNQVVTASALNLKPDDILETVCRELALAFDISRASVALLDVERFVVRVVAEYLGRERSPTLNRVVPVKDHPMARFLLTQKAPLIAADAPRDPRLASLCADLPRPAPVSLMAVPLAVQDEVIGWLSLETDRRREFPAEEVDLVWSIADQAAGALVRARLAQDRQRLVTAIDQTADAVVVTDAQGEMLYVNPAFERMTGYRQAEVLGQSTRILKSGKQDASVYQGLWSAVISGQVWHGRLINRRKDGSLYTADVAISPVRDDDGAIANYVGIQRDVTRELQLEEQYRQAQKMEAVGRLTAGITHDFNNLLTAINGFAELMQLQLGPADPLYAYVTEILYSGRRAADLTGQLLAFSRKQIIEPRALNLNTVITGMSEMLRRVIGEHIEMKTCLDAGLWPVRADPTQIEQVIANLAVNARDAMPGGGQLSIETANVVLDEGYAAGHLEVRPGEYVLLSVGDTGIGMSDQVKAHLFEPFFTTKEVGKGTGLGLATVHGIVKQSGGHISVCSEEGMGATFKVYLPRDEAAARETTPPQEEILAMLPGTETVLLVEDDDRVRSLTLQILQYLGYTVLEARDGGEALERSQEHPGDIHLVLTDVVMPGMGGGVVAEQLRRTRPSLKVLFMSGYTDDETILNHGVSGSRVAFLQKPFGAAALTHKVRQVLDETG